GGIAAGAGGTLRDLELAERRDAHLLILAERALDVRDHCVNRSPCLLLRELGIQGDSVAQIFLAHLSSSTWGCDPGTAGQARGPRSAGPAIGANRRVNERLPLSAVKGKKHAFARKHGRKCGWQPAGGKKGPPPRGGRGPPSVTFWQQS